MLGVYIPVNYAADLDDKIKQSRQYLKDNRDDPIAYEDLGWAYLNRFDQRGNRDDVHKALKIFQSYRKVSRKGPRPYYSLGVAWFKLGDVDKAQKYFRETLSRDPDNFESLIALGNVLSSKGQFKEAYTYYKETGQLNPDSAVVYTNLSQLAFEMGQYQKAIKLSNSALEKQSDNIVPLLLQAKSYRFLGQDEKSINLLKKVLKNTPDNSRAYLDLAWSWYNLGDFPRAKTLALRHNALAPDSMGGLELLAQLYKKTGDKDRMMGVVKLAEDQYMKNNRSGNLLGALAWLNCEYDLNPQQGLEYARKYLERKRTDDAFSTLGWAYYKNDNYAEALDQFKKAIKLNPNLSNHWYRRGLTHKKMGDKKSAQMAFKRALTVGPNTYHEESNEELFLLSSKLN